jgi:hypothetical protein
MNPICLYRYADKLKRQVTFVLSTMMVLSACVEPYDPPTSSNVEDLLVVDGFLNTAYGSVNVVLTHSKPLDSEDETLTESNATLSIRSEGGAQFSLSEQTPGTYTAEGLPLNPAEKYLLNVRTANGQEFQSDYVDIPSTPVIDSVVWKADADGVTFYINSHDASANTRYYRWDYIETWEYTAFVSSDFKVENNEIVYRNGNERIHTCWNTVPSTKISIESTVRLSEDVVSNYPLTFIPKGSSKVSVMYSILVRQRAISKDEYNFLEQLQKTTESIGGLFDPQPSQVPGNIHNLTDPSSTVLGYFGAGATQEQRVFVRFTDLPRELQDYNRNPNCQPDTLCVIQSIPSVYQCALNIQDLNGSEYIGSALYIGPSIGGYTLSNYSCADCRAQGGTLTKPGFWP